MREKGLPGLKKWPYTEADAPFFSRIRAQTFLGEERRWLKAEHASSTWCVQAKTNDVGLSGECGNSACIPEKHIVDPNIDNAC